MVFGKQIRLITGYRTAVPRGYRERRYVGPKWMIQLITGIIRHIVTTINATLSVRWLGRTHGIQLLPVEKLECYQHNARDVLLKYFIPALAIRYCFRRHAIIRHNE